MAEQDTESTGYKIISAFFCQGFDPDDSEPARNAKMIGFLHATTTTAKVQVFVDVEGPPGRADSAMLGVTIAGGKETRIGPEHFHFGTDGRAKMVFFLNAMPLTALGAVTAHLRFSGGQVATAVCSMQIVAPPLPDGSATH